MSNDISFSYHTEQTAIKGKVMSEWVMRTFTQGLKNTFNFMFKGQKVKYLLLNTTSTNKLAKILQKAQHLRGPPK